MEATHASFFSGVGGLDMGLERAGWRTVSFSEIDPYASAVLAERWPDVPNLGDITSLADDARGRREPDARDGEWTGAVLWTGGFPCQDLSVAGKRRGFTTPELHRSDGGGPESRNGGSHDRSDWLSGALTRSGLAFAFLDLAAVHRPRFILLENVPGLLSSHGGRDMAALLGALVELGYGVGYRVLDARYFGVPQRRRRVFILGVSLGGRAGAECAAEVLSVGSRCHRHPPTGVEAGAGVAAGAGDSPGEPEYLRQSVNAKWSKGYSGPAGDEHHNLTVSASPHPGRVRAADGLAGRLDDRDGVVNALDQRRGGADDNEAQAGHLITQGGGVRTEPGAHLVAVGFSENQRGEVLTHEQAHQLTSGGGKPGQGYSATLGAFGVSDDPLLPLGLDSHRYRCCGNGVVSDVSEWIGQRLIGVLHG